MQIFWDYMEHQLVLDVLNQSHRFNIDELNLITMFANTVYKNDKSLKKMICAVMQSIVVMKAMSFLKKKLTSLRK